MNKRLYIAAVLITLAFTGTTFAQSLSSSTPYVRPDAQTRRSRYIKSMFGLSAAAGIIVGAGISTARDKPPEWGPHWDGFGKRLASNTGKRLIDKSLQFGLDEALRLDSHYYPSTGGTRSRVLNAVASVFTARKPNGKRVVGVPRLAGIYASQIIAAETWYPDRYNWKDGVRFGTATVGVNVAYNLVKEFLFR